MSEVFLLYLWTRLDAMHALFALAALVTGIVWCVATFVQVLTANVEPNAYRARRSLGDADRFT